MGKVQPARPRLIRHSTHSSYFSSNNLIYQAYITPLKSCTINWILRRFEKSPMSCCCYIYCVAYSGLDTIIEKEKRHMLIFLGGIGGKNKALNNKNVSRFSFDLYIFLIQILNWTMYNVALIHKRLHSWCLDIFISKSPKNYIHNKIIILQWDGSIHVIYLLV